MHAEREIGGLLRLEGAAGQFGDDRDLARGRGNLPIAAPPSLTKSCALRSRALPTPMTIRRDTVKARRRDDVERRAVFALEPVGGCRSRHQVAGRGESLAGRRAEFEPLLAEHDENALGGRAEGGKFKLGGGRGMVGFVPILVRRESGMSRLAAPAKPGCGSRAKTAWPGSARGRRLTPPADLTFCCA